MNTQKASKCGDQRGVSLGGEVDKDMGGSEMLQCL